jgi:hypothetical protein
MSARLQHELNCSLIMFCSRCRHSYITENRKKCLLLAYRMFTSRPVHGWVYMELDGFLSTHLLISLDGFDRVVLGGLDVPW